jgi:branched-chain amino acid transport system ATP-binding protein
MTVLEAETIGLSFGGVRALSDVSFKASAGAIFALVGPNGAGKTSMFNVVSGLYRPTIGRVRLMGADVTGRPPHELARLGLSRTFQNLQIFSHMSVVDNVMVGLHLGERTSWLSDLLGLRSVMRQNRDSRRTAMALLERVDLAARADEQASNLSYGELKRLEIARALATGPKVLLLDEPAAGCNPVETKEMAALIRQIRADGVTIVLVEHDMGLVMSISDHIVVLDQGRVIAEGEAEDIRTNPAVISAYLGSRATQKAAP